MSGGVLEIAGTGKSDFISVYIDAGDASKLDMRIRNDVTQFNMADVASIRIESLAGSDHPGTIEQESITHRTDAIAWVLTVCSGCLRLSQAKALANLVRAAMRVQRISLANIGRAMLGSAKHQIKRCWRFCANPRVEIADAMRPIVAKLLKERKKKLLVAVDWVDIKGFQSLVASVALKVRSIPICWASTTNHVYDGHRSRNAFEESLLLVLRDMIRRSIKVIVLADRGFGRTALAGFWQRQGFGYVIRIQPTVTVHQHGYYGKLLDYPVYKGITKPERIDRLRLILAIAYLLLCGVGVIAKARFRPCAWCSTNRQRECSICMIGLIMPRKMDVTPPEAFAAVRELSESASPNWG